MLLTLLGIGAYTTYKWLDAEDKKSRWNKLMANCDMDNEEDFNEFLKVMKTSREDIINFYDRDISDFLFYSKKNLRTIPYFTDNDIRKFEQKVYRIRAEHFIQERKKALHQHQEVWKSLNRSLKINQPIERC